MLFWSFSTVSLENNMDKTDFQNKLQSGPILNYSRGWEKGRIKFDIMPKEFLKYAEDCLPSKNDANLVNALTNTKRALDCQIELIIYEHGYGKILKRENWNFPKKIQFLKERFIIAPRVLEKINKTRNLLEHEFKRPCIENVEDACDVVTLFIGYSEKLTRIPDSLAIGFDTSTTECVKVSFDKVNLKFDVYDNGIILFSLTDTDKGFERLIALFHGTQPATYTLMHRSEIEENTY